MPSKKLTCLTVLVQCPCTNTELLPPRSTTAGAMDHCLVLTQNYYPRRSTSVGATNHCQTDPAARDHRQRALWGGVARAVEG